MSEDVFKLHADHTGVLGIESYLDVQNKAQLGQAYTPGVAKIAKDIQAHPADKDKYTMSGKLVALVTDGTAVLGLGDIGPAGGLPIIEGKALLYKDLAGVNAIPLAIAPNNAKTIAKEIKDLSLSFAGIHLEDIAAPKCFEIEAILSQELNIPVYHDDQEGTAIVILAGLINAAKVVGKSLKDLKVVMNGIGASGVATARLLKHAGIQHVTLVDIDGVVKANSKNYNHYQTDLAAQFTSEEGQTLDDVIDNQDVFIGLSVANVLSADQIKRMANQPIIMALANPVPEVDPAVAQAAGAAVIATGSSQYPNQVNNILAFPGLFKGLLASGIKQVDLQIEAVVAQTIADIVQQPTAQKIVPDVFHDDVVNTVCDAIVNYKK